MEKIIRIYNLHDQAQYEDEVEYWLNVDPQDKLSITQDLREQYIKLLNTEKSYIDLRKAIRTEFKIIPLKLEQL